MEQKICLDTDVIIDFLNNKDKAGVGKILNRQQPMCTSVVTAFELRRRKDNREEVETFLRDIQIIPFSNNDSSIAAFISLQLDRSGTPVEFRDVFIAATCMNSNYKLLTNNKSDFTKIKGLVLA